MSDVHLRLSKVHRHYGEGERQVRVLEAADLEVRGGELVAIVAPSGAGKSTLLHLSGLLERPQGGEVEITGIPTSKLNERGRTLLRRVTAGQGLRQVDLRARQWFAAGDMVKVVAVGRGFAISSSGQALSHGIEGQTVRVRTENGRVVSGAPAGDRRVEIRL